MCPALKIALLGIAVCLEAPAALAQFIDIRISVKWILGPSGEPPSVSPSECAPYNWLDPAWWQSQIDEANVRYGAYGRGIRFASPVFEGGIAGASQFFNLYESLNNDFELTARANPAQFRWRDDAVNVYVFNSVGGTPDAPKCQGWAGGHPLPGTLGCEGHTFPNRSVMIVFCARTNAGLAHEFGHHFGLPHTWVPNHAPETPVDADPDLCSSPPDCNAYPACTVDPYCRGAASLCTCCCMESNTLALAAAQGWTPQQYEVMRYNIMSYHCGVPEHGFQMSDGQWDKFCDMIKTWKHDYCRSETTGEPIFVHWNAPFPYWGYSRFPFRTVADGVSAANPAGGDILLIRSGSYGENLTINRRVTLRSDRGTVRIGQ